CLTSYYSDLWSDEFKLVFTADSWSKYDARLSNTHFKNLKNEWTWNTPLRTDYSRRQALIEIDVLSAMSLGLDLNQLKSIYRFNFYVLRSYDTNTFYDAKGRIVFTNNGSLKNVGFSRKEFEEIKDKKSGVFTRTIIDETLNDTPVERVIEYHAPFDKCDREKDYETAWSYFSKLRS
ncbi:MAG: class I SAM-dependent DNA methyltransferase, partial [Deltaproteobacteria bacterium]|nr:class I SAM-dependent DNA methyltransferase [Deltaproteobacteria bacterium]